MNFNWVEIVGACTGITYIILEVRQNMLLWPVGLLNALFYAVIFYTGGLYAIMSLQFYYVAMMIYGWWNWQQVKKEDIDSGAEQIAVRRVPKPAWLPIGVATLAVWSVIYFVLQQYTDSQVPQWDAVATALSITGTWMLAKKYLEQWLVWIFVNVFSIWLYASQGLHITAVLYAFYAVMATVGFFNWKKDLCPE